MEESFAEIRARREREFQISQILAAPSDKRSVWPWMVRIEELKQEIRDLKMQISQETWH